MNFELLEAMKQRFLRSLTKFFIHLAGEKSGSLAIFLLSFTLGVQINVAVFLILLSMKKLLKVISMVTILIL